MHIDMDSLLLCDEEMFFSTPSRSPAGRRDAATRPCVESDYPSNEEADHVLQNYLNRERIYAPASGYLGRLRLSSDLRDARLRAVRWIIVAGGRLGLQYGTIFSAVNYLDRFISLNCHIKQWEVWMMELVSIACLSIASKVDEVFIHSLDDFQAEELEHMYQPSTIQRMELAILKALDWRLLCITPYSYAGLLIHRLASSDAPLGSRTVELLTRALLEAEFVDCSACSLAVSALRCSIEELVPLESDSYNSVLDNLMPVERRAAVDNCHKIMEERMASPGCCPTSPVTVIPAQRTEVLDSHVDIDTCFLFDGDGSRDFNPKRKRENLRSSPSK